MSITTAFNIAQILISLVLSGAALFGAGDLGAIDEVTLAAAVAELPGAEGAAGERIDQLLARTGLARSVSDARRALGQGGVSVNNRRVEVEDPVLEEDDLLHGRFAVLRRGKRTLAAVTSA